MIYRLTFSLFLSCILLFVTGCSSTAKSSQDPNISAIKTVLEHQFTGPEKEFLEGLDDTEKLEHYYEKRYKPYFTDEKYTSFIATTAFQYVLVAHNNGKEIKAEKMDVEKEEDVYTFKVTVLYGKKDGDHQESAEVTGRVKFNEEGKITNLQYLNDGGLSESLSK